MINALNQTVIYYGKRYWIVATNPINNPINRNKIFSENWKDEKTHSKLHLQFFITYS